MIQDFFTDYNIDTAPEGHKHFRDGWVNTECPFCSGSHGYHLGFNIDDKYFYCFRCGFHKVNDTLPKLLGVERATAIKVANDYGIYSSKRRRPTNQNIKIGKHPFRFPTGTMEMRSAHRKYLERRGFDPELIEREFDLYGTGPVSQLKNPESGKVIPYQYRILMPIYWNGKVVSFQTRDYTDKQSMSYLTCPMSREVIHHKHIIYGKSKKNWGETGLGVEGVFDSFRFINDSFSTFGVGYTTDQVRIISETFKRVFLLFDSEPQAQAKAKKLKSELVLRGVRTKIIKIETGLDPADMDQDDADYLLKELKRKVFRK